MEIDMKIELERLHGMTVKELQVKYLEVFSEQARSTNKDFLVKRLGWRLQANHEGGLTERALKRAAELVNESDVRIRMPREGSKNSPPAIPAIPGPFPSTRDSRLPPPNTVLSRKYKGRVIEVTVLENSFDYEGTTFPTLSAAAKAATGSHCSGFAFFKI